MIEIPKSLSHLKVDPRGYVIHFFVPFVNGKPEFKLQDGKKFKLSTENSLCHICGKKLHKDFHYFVSGPMGLQNQVSSDAAMHRECAEYSLKVCPHLFYKKAERKIIESDLTPSAHILEKPEFLFLIKSSKYKVKLHPEVGYPLIHYKAVSSEKYIYVDNKLQKEL